MSRFRASEWIVPPLIVPPLIVPLFLLLLVCTAALLNG